MPQNYPAKEVIMQKKVIHTDKAPKAIGPYSQAIRIDSIIYTAGQIAIDPATGELVAGSVEEQTRQVCTNLRNVLEAAGSNMNQVVKTTVFLKDMNDFPKMNAIYAEFFGENPPARSTVAVAALPKGGLVEIEVVALAA
jgi:2-iminobutanoate/2-iminopropanoate deaminase